MTKWLRYRILLYFLAGLIGLDAVVFACRKVWRSYDPDDYLERLEACRASEWDLIVVGGSPVTEGIDPALLAGVSWHGQPLNRAFNLGLPGATTSDVWHAVEHGITRPPRLLVYGLTASDLNDARDEPHGPRALMSAADMRCWTQLRPEAAGWCIRQYLYGRSAEIWNLYRYRNGIRLWAANQIEGIHADACPDAAAESQRGLQLSQAIHSANGFAPSLEEARTRHFDRMKAEGYVPPHFHYLDDYHLGGHLGYLHRLLDWGQEQGVKIVLLDMPVTHDLEDCLDPAPYACYRQALAEVERTRGARVLRATRQAVGLTDADFSDLIHLNADGTARLGAWLRRALEGLGSR